MKKPKIHYIRLLIAITTIAWALAFTALKVIEWKVKDTYSVKCSVGKNGNLKGLKAKILFDEQNPEKSKIIALIDARTISVGEELMNEHAREALNTDKFPVITFESTAVAKTASGYEATGKLTIKGITKSIKLPFIFDSKKMSDKFPFVDKQTFSGLLIITPKDFNITRAGTPKEVIINLTVPVTP